MGPNRSNNNNNEDTKNVNSAHSQVDDKAAHADESTKEQQQVTKFLDEGVHERAAIAKITPSMPCAIKTGKEPKNHTIRDFMNRPNKLYQFTWKSSDEPTKLITRVTTPNDLFKRKMIMEKISGFTLFRATTVFKIQINATPFQQGRLLALFVPYGSKARRTITALEHLGGITGFPHVDIDIAQVQTMTLRVPFVSPLTHINLVRGYGTIGELRLYVYGKLQAAEDTQVTGTVWGWFEDIETEIPTGAKVHDILLQAGTQARGAKPEGATNDLSELAQAAVPILNTVSQLSSLALEKPVTLKHAMPMQPSLQRTFANGKGVDTSKTLTIAPAAQVAPFPGKFGSSQNEMEIDYIKSTPSYLDQFKWNTSDTANKTLWYASVSPSYLPKNFQSYLKTAEPTTLAFLSTAFKYWQGDLIYTFKFVKTGYHSGRVRLVFIPGAFPSKDLQYDPDKCYSTVLDLREKAEFEVQIPYVNSTPWERVEDNPGYTSFGSIGIGAIIVEVLNELIAPGITSNEITCLVEIRAGDNFSLAFPTAPGWIPISSQPHDIQLQAYDEAVTRDAAQEHTDEPEKLFESSLVHAENCSEKYCIGEQVKSIKSLLMRFNYVDSYNQHHLLMMPWFANSSTMGEDPVIESRKWGDYYSYFSSIFAFQCGGMRVKLINVGEIPSRAYVTLATEALVPITVAEAGKDYEINNEAAYCPFPRTVCYPNREGAVEVEVPFYSQTYATMTTTNAPLLPQQDDPSNWKGQSVHFQFHGDSGWFSAFRAVADDFEFGYLVGAPRLTRAYRNFP